jgi:membrane protease YdiL (CAAX protease family)
VTGSWFYLPDGRLRPVWRFFLSVVMFLAASVVAMAFGLFVGGKDMKLLALISRPLLMVLLLLGYTWMLRVFDGVHQRRLAAMGLPGGRGSIGDSLFGILLGTAMVIFTVAIIAWRGNLHIATDAHGLRTGVLLVEVLVVLSTAAMAEEIAFRGYPFQRLVEATGPGGAIALMSALFGAVHLANPNASTVGLLNTMLIGILFALAFLRSGALWLPWGMHWAWNAVLGAGIGLPVSGLDMSAGIRSRATGPGWLTGGAYGPEASIACTVSVVMALIIVLVAFHRRPDGIEESLDGSPAASIQSK